MTRDDRRDRRLLAVQQELKVRPPFERNRRCGHDDRGAEIATIASSAMRMSLAIPKVRPRFWGASLGQRPARRDNSASTRKATQETTFCLHPAFTQVSRTPRDRSNIGDKYWL